MEAPAAQSSAAARGEAEKHQPPTACVQGLGFVGTAMALAVATAREQDGSPSYQVVGVELDTEEGRRKAQAINEGRLPMRSADPKLEDALRLAVETGNLRATTDESAYEAATVALMDVHLDLSLDDGRPSVDFGGLRAAVRALGERLPAGALVVVETTVPPGTCEKVIAPELEDALARRGMETESILLAHAYERVMPGPEYLDSIVNFWRVYAGHTPAAAEACERFLSKVVNVEAYPLTRLSSTTASETGKVLENSYRATTIAFMEEWGRFAEAVGVDLFEVISAIRRRPTHSNMRQPGFGVGGYCLPKDPLFAKVAARDLFDLPHLEFPFSERAVKVNEVMPLVTLDNLDKLLGGLKDRRILLLGLSYRQGVDDMRFSPSAIFVHHAQLRGADVVSHDPIVSESADGIPVVGEMPSAEGFDAVVFAVGHREYLDMDLLAWLGDSRPLVLDSNDVLSGRMLEQLAEKGCIVWAIGRGPVGLSLASQ